MPDPVTPPATDVARATTIRTVAIGASIVAAGTYLLIGLGVVSVGTSTSEAGTPDLFAFGAMMGAIFAISAVLLWRFATRLIWSAVAVLQAATLIGYVAFASYREPPFDLWGALIKLCQAVVLGAMAYLLLHPHALEARRGRERHAAPA